MPARYRRNGRDVEAILVDGTAQAAAEISQRFGGCAADHGSAVEVATNFGRVYAGAGCWVVRDLATRRLSVVDDREFSAHYELLDVVDHLPLNRRSFARLPADRWSAA